MIKMNYNPHFSMFEKTTFFWKIKGSILTLNGHKNCGQVEETESSVQPPEKLKIPR